MADIPTAENLQGDFVLAQTVELIVSASEVAATDRYDNADALGTGTTPDKLYAMTGQDLDIRYPRSRFNHGLTRSYGHGAPDITMEFTLEGTHDIVPWVRTRATRDARGNLPIYAYGVRMTSVDDTKKVIRFRGKMEGVHYSKREGDQENPISVRCSIIITDDTLPTSTAT